MSSGGGSTPAQTFSTSVPWGDQIPALDTGLAQAQNLYNTPAYWPQYYSGNTYASLGSQGQNAIGEINYVGSNGTDVGNSALGSNQQFTSGDMLNANLGNPALNSIDSGQGLGQAALGSFASGNTASASNPYFTQMAQTTLANTMPGIMSGFASGDRMDSGLASRAASMGANDAVGQLAYQNYQQGLQQQQQAATTLGAQQLGAAGQLSQNSSGAMGNMLQAGALAPSLDQMQIGNYQDALSADQVAQQNEQNQTNADIQRWNYNENMPWNTLGMYDQLVNGNYGGSSSTSTPMYSNPTASALSGIAGGLGALNAGAGLYNSIAGGTGAAGATAAALGAASGATDAGLSSAMALFSPLALM